MTLTTGGDAVYQDRHSEEGEGEEFVQSRFSVGIPICQVQNGKPGYGDQECVEVL